MKDSSEEVILSLMRKMRIVCEKERSSISGRIPIACKEAPRQEKVGLQQELIEDTFGGRHSKQGRDWDWRIKLME